MEREYHKKYRLYFRNHHGGSLLYVGTDPYWAEMLFTVLARALLGTKSRREQKEDEEV